MPEPKKKVGIFLPEPFAVALDAWAKARVNGKEKWLVASAAVLTFLELTEDQKGDCIRRLKDADTPGRTFAALLTEGGKGTAEPYTEATGVSPRQSQKASGQAKPKGKSAKTSTRN